LAFEVDACLNDQSPTQSSAARAALDLNRVKKSQAMRLAALAQS